MHQPPGVDPTTHQLGPISAPNTEAVDRRRQTSAPLKQTQPPTRDCYPRPEPRTDPRSHSRTSTRHADFYLKGVRPNSRFPQEPAIMTSPSSSDRRPGTSTRLASGPQKRIRSQLPPAFLFPFSVIPPRSDSPHLCRLRTYRAVTPSRQRPLASMLGKFFYGHPCPPARAKPAQLPVACQLRRAGPAHGPGILPSPRALALGAGPLGPSAIPSVCSFRASMPEMSSGIHAAPPLLLPRHPCRGASIQPGGPSTSPRDTLDSIGQRECSAREDSLGALASLPLPRSCRE